MLLFLLSLLQNVDLVFELGILVFELGVLVLCLFQLAFLVPDVLHAGLVECRHNSCAL